jgi:hypothetical protein
MLASSRSRCRENGNAHSVSMGLVDVAIRARTSLNIHRSYFKCVYVIILYIPIHTLHNATVSRADLLACCKYAFVGASVCSSKRWYSIVSMISIAILCNIWRVNTGVWLMPLQIVYARLYRDSAISGANYTVVDLLKFVYYFHTALR